MTFWDKVQRDLKKGIKVVRAKAEELTEEGKRRYKIFELKTKVQRWISELGGRVYELSATVENPMQDTTVQLMVSRIKKLEAQITRLEGKAKTTNKKPASRKKAKSGKK